MKHIILPFSIALLLFSCTFPMRTSLTDVVRNSHKTVYTVSPVSEATITKETKIIIDFNAPVPTETFVFEGALSEEMARPIWQKNSTRLIISPVDVWSEGAGKDLIVTGLDIHGYHCVVDHTYGVIDRTVYVSPNGENSNPGTADAPLDSVVDAVNTLHDLTIDGTVKIGIGEYLLGTPIDLNRSVCIQGGFDDERWEPAASGETVLIADYADTYSADDPLFSIETTESLAIRIEHLSVFAEDSVGYFDGAGQVTVTDVQCTVHDITSQFDMFTFQDTSARITNCTVDLSSGNKCSIISAENTEIHISDSLFQTNSRYASGDLTGLELLNCSGTINGNRMLFTNDADDDDSKTIMIHLNGSSEMAVYNNLLVGNDAIVCYGIKLDNSSAGLYNNTIVIGTHHSNWYLENILCGIASMNNSNPRIINNIIGADATVLLDSVPNGGFLLRAKAYVWGIYQEDTGDYPEALVGNVIFNCTAGEYYSAHDNTCYAADPENTFLPEHSETLTTLKSVLGNNGISEADFDSNHWGIDPALDSQDYSLSAQTPTSIKTGAWNLSDIFDTDLEGTAREDVWSIGAIEYVE